MGAPLGARLGRTSRLLRRLAMVVVGAAVALSSPGLGLGQAKADYTGTNTPDWAIGPFTRDPGNPILSPQGSGFESANTFNPGVIVRTDPTTHTPNTFEMLYRAQDGSGAGGVSRIGYATSTDGHTWTRYANNPVISPATDTLSSDSCGVEDPRLYEMKGNPSTGVPDANSTTSIFYTFYTAVHGNPTYPNCGNGFDLSEAWSTNLTTWHYIGAVQTNTKDALVVADPNGTPVKITVNGTPTYVMYYGQDSPGTNIAYSLDMLHWHNVANILNVGASQSGDPVSMHFPAGYSSWEIAYAVTDYQSVDGGPINHNILLFVAGNLMSNGRWFYAASEVLFDRNNLTTQLDQLSDPILSPDASYERISPASPNAIWMNSIFFYQGQWWMYYGAGDHVVALATAPLHEHEASPPAGTEFTTSFDTGQPLPDWVDSVDTGNGTDHAGSIANVGGYPGAAAPESGIRQEATHTGTQALLYSGSPGGQPDNHAYMKLFDLSSNPITVAANTTLSYWVYPQSANATCVAVDLIFNAGDALRNQVVNDENGVRLRPSSQCNTLTPNQWNLVTADIGSAAALVGKQVVRIDFGYDQPNGSGTYRGYLDDISITDSSTPMSADPASLVNPFIGTSAMAGATDGQIDTFPGADVPFGMVQWSPDTNSRPAGGGYNYTDGTITGFSLTHMSGPGCARYGDIPILPTTGGISGPGGATQTFAHNVQEIASPGYYQVGLGGSEATRILTQLTVTPRTGLGQFTFPYTTQANLLFKVGGSANADSAATATIVGTNEVDGSATSGHFCGSPGTYTVYFAAQFDRSFSGHGTWSGSTVNAGSNSVNNANGGAYVTFDASSDTTVEVRVGISFVSIANAKLNLTNENSGWDLGAVASAAHDSWNALLSRASVSGGTFTQERTYYTALYHAALHPNLFSDVNGQYMGFDNQVHTVSGGQGAQYANFSGWDIYHSEIPLLALIAPTETGDMIQSMVNEAAQGGWFDRWAAANDYTGIMSGDPADAIIAEAYAMGVRNFDAEAALTQMKKGATQLPTAVQYGQGWYVERPQLAPYLAMGFMPNGFVTTGHTPVVSPVDVGASATLEYAIDDFSIAQLSNALHSGDTATYDTYMSRAQNWQNLFNAANGYIGTRDGSGAFMAGDPTTTDIDGTNDQHGYAEGNSAQYTWMIPQNLNALFAAMGGKSAAIARLDAFFSQLNAGRVSPHEWAGNEPNFGSPWLYDYAGQPYKTQNTVRQIVNTLFNTTPAGEPGNDDLGALSSWYVWAALGLYPETPGTPTLALNSPLFPQATITLAGGHQLVINGNGAAANAPYVQSLQVNGLTSQDTSISVTDVLSRPGATTLDFTLGTTANTSWGSAVGHAPPSYADGSAPAIVRFDQGSVTVAPGGASATVNLIAHNTTDSPIQIDVAPNPPSGVTVTPQTTPLSVPADGESQVQLTVSAAGGTAENDYLVPIGLAVGAHAMTPPNLPVIVAASGSILRAYDSTGITSDSAQWAADLDGFGYTYSYQGLSAAGLTPGATVSGLTWPVVPAGLPDNAMASGQTVSVAGVSGATVLAFLGSATNGPSTGTVTLHYATGSDQTQPLTLSDWTLNGGTVAPSTGNQIVATLPYRNWTGASTEVAFTPQPARNPETTYVFLATVLLDSSRTLVSVTLPGTVNNGHMHIFAIGTPPPATITSVTPPSAKPGDIVTITGTNFGPQQGAGFVAFVDNGVNWGSLGNLGTFVVNSWSDTQITFTVPLPSGTTNQWRVIQGTHASVTVHGDAGSISNTNSSLLIANSSKISDYYTSILVSPDSNRGCTGFVQTPGTYLSADALAANNPSIVPGGTVTTGGFSFTWPNPANCYFDSVAPSSQTILMDPKVGATQLGLLGTGPNGASTGAITVTYADNSTFVMDGQGGRPLPGFGDWCNTALATNNTRVATMSYRNDNGAQQNVTCYLFLDTLSGLDPNKTVVSITLPNGLDGTHGNNMRIFAIALNGTANTTTTVSADNNPSVYGQPVTFTASVSSGVAGTPAGTVQFKDGGNNLGSAVTLDGTGHASSGPLPGLSVGTHSITAVYSGDGSFNTSTSTTLPQVVNQAATTTAVVSDRNPSSYGQGVTFTATVTATAPGAGTPTGTVQFAVDGSPSGIPVSLVGGQASSAAVTGLSNGTHTVTATYGGDADFSGSTSPEVNQDVEQTATSTGITSDHNPSAFGQPVTFTATVTSDIGTPTGSVQFKVDGVPFGSPVALDGGGQAGSAANGALSVGSHSIIAVYTGDGAFASSTSTSTPLSQPVNKAATGTALISDHNPSVFGQAVTFTATVTATAPGGGTPGGTVQFMDGGTSLGSPVTLSGGQASSGSISTFAVAGHTITAVYSGSSSFSPSTSDPLTQTVNKAATSTAVDSDHPTTVFGQSVTFTATVTVTGAGAGTLTGTVQFKDGTTTLCAASNLSGGQASCGPITNLAVAGHTITAVYSGDGNFSTSTDSSFTQTMSQAATGTALISDHPSSAFGGAVTFTATVTVTAPGAGTPSGTVQFKDGTTTLCAASTLSSGQASCGPFTALSVGSHSITAIYAGDPDFSTSTSDALTQSVGTATTGTALISDHNPSAVGQSVTFTATVTSGSGTPTGTVQFKDGTASLGSPVTLSGGQASSGAITNLSVGDHTITAVYGGAASFGTSTSDPLTQTVNQAATTIVISNAASLGSTPSVVGQPYTVAWTVSVTSPGAGVPTGTVTVSGGSGCTAPAGNGHCDVTSTATGAKSLVAAYNGDANFSASTSGSATHNVNQAATSTAVTSDHNPSNPGQMVKFTATVTVSTPGAGTPTGTVQFADTTTSTTLCPSATVSGGQATCQISSLSSGTHTITAAYTSDSPNLGGSTSAGLSQSVNAIATNTGLSSDHNPSVFGQAVTFTATVTSGSGTPTGSVQFKDGAANLGAPVTLDSGGHASSGAVGNLSVGSHGITAVYTGNGSFSGSASTSSALGQIVNKAVTSTTISSNHNPSVFGQAVTFTATVRATAPGAGTPTGTVQFRAGSTNLGSPVVLDGSGHAHTAALTTLSVGTHAITAVYSGASSFVASTSPAVSQKVNKSASKAVVTSSKNPSVKGKAVTFTATVTAVSPGGGTPTGKVQFMLDGKAIGSLVTLSHGKAALTIAASKLTAGKHAIQVVYKGSASFSVSTSAKLTQTVK